MTRRELYEENKHNTQSNIKMRFEEFTILNELGNSWSKLDTLRYL